MATITRENIGTLTDKLTVQAVKKVSSIVALVTKPIFVMVNLKCLSATLAVFLSNPKPDMVQ